MVKGDDHWKRSPQLLVDLVNSSGFN